MSRKKPNALVSAGWEDILGWLPPDLDEMAYRTGGFERRRELRRPSDVLRLAFAYAVCDLSLRGVAAWAATHGIAKVSDVAVLKRLRRLVPFLEALLAWLLGRQLFEPPTAVMALRVRILDATTLTAPGGTGADWRVHATYDVARGTFDTIELTDGKGGEHLDRARLRPGDLGIFDRGYAHRARIVEAVESGAHVLVRIGHSAVPLADGKGQPVDVLKFALRRRDRPGRPPRVEELPVWLARPGGAPLPMRLIVVRKSQQDAERERRRLNREGKRKGKTPSRRTLDAAAFVFLLTSVPAAWVDAVPMADLYRVRWQVELAFKRLKSLLHLDALRAWDSKLGRTYVLTKLIAALLAQTLARGARAFSPWGVPLRAGPVEPVAA